MCYVKKIQNLLENCVRPSWKLGNTTHSGGDRAHRRCLCTYHRWFNGRVVLVELESTCHAQGLDLHVNLDVSSDEAQNVLTSCNDMRKERSGAGTEGVRASRCFCLPV